MHVWVKTLKKTKTFFFPILLEWNDDMDDVTFTHSLSLTLINILLHGELRII